MDAEVIEFFPAGDSEPNLIWRERSNFEMKTGLSGIDFTELGAYNKLLLQIEDFREEESAAENYALSLKEASARWEQDIYLPVVRLIKKNSAFWMNFPIGPRPIFSSMLPTTKVAKSRLTKQKKSVIGRHWKISK